MENHPIPQDITGFQFKLIGDMTVKQFAYVAVGVIIGWLFFVSPLFFIIKILFAVSFVALGLGLAFVPIDGRPMDLMILNFFKAVFNPTQYIYDKQGTNLWAENLPKNASAKSLSEEQLNKFMNKNAKNQNKIDKKESVFFQNIQTYSAASANTVPNAVPEHYYATQAGNLNAQGPNQKGEKEIKTSDEAINQEKFSNAALILEKELLQAKAAEAKQNQIDPKAFLETHQKVLELQKQLNDILSQKDELQKKLIELQKNMAEGQNTAFVPSLAQDEPDKETASARSIPASMTKSIGLPDTPEFPNLLTGIVKDPRGNPLSNVLVEVKDEEGNAVRAFKTNALGQFASATALNNGKYTIDFEDPKAENKFVRIAFTTNGEVIMPIEVISLDQREELRRSLFN